MLKEFTNDDLRCVLDSITGQIVLLPRNQGAVTTLELIRMVKCLASRADLIGYLSDNIFDMDVSQFPADTEAIIQCYNSGLLDGIDELITAITIKHLNYELSQFKVH